GRADVSVTQLAPVAVAVLLHAIGSVQFHRGDYMPLPIGESRPARDPQLLVDVVAVGRHAALSDGAKAFHLCIEDEIHDARYRIGAVCRRRTTRDDVHAFHQQLWESGDVGGAGNPTG